MWTQPFSWQLDCSSVVHEHETWLLTLLNYVSELLVIELVVSELIWGNQFWGISDWGQSENELIWENQFWGYL